MSLMVSTEEPLCEKFAKWLVKDGGGSTLCDTGEGEAAQTPPLWV